MVLYIPNNTMDVCREYGYVFTKNTQVEIVKLKTTGGMWCGDSVYTK